MRYFQRNLLKGIQLAPPGYTSAKSALAIIRNRGNFLADQESWDAIEKGIELLRSGPALAEADVLLAHPTTWSAIRRQTTTIS